jgi:hypothetical protein
MSNYVFEYIFPAITSFMQLKMYMNQKNTDAVSTLFKAMFKAIPFKTGILADKNIQIFLRELKNIPIMKELAGN